MESTKLVNFKGHLPEIQIDANYLNTLRDVKLNPSDKAEKIIRDIETVIRRNEVNSAAYTSFQQRLDDLINKKKDESIAIEELLTKLYDLYAELDEITTLPQRMGFIDKGTFEIFMIIKNIVNGNDELIKAFSQELVETKIKKIVYIGWQDVSKEVESMRVVIKLFLALPKYRGLKLYENKELLEAMTKTVTKYFKVE